MHLSVESRVASARCYAGDLDRWSFATSGAKGVQRYPVNGKYGLGSGRILYSYGIFGHITVRSVYASWKMVVVLRHSGRTSHTRDAVYSCKTVCSRMAYLDVHAHCENEKFNVVSDELRLMRVAKYRCRGDTRCCVRRRRSLRVPALVGTEESVGRIQLVTPITKVWTRARIERDYLQVLMVENSHECGCALMTRVSEFEF